MKEQRNPLYLFACHLQWREKRDLDAYKYLVAALDDPDREIRKLVESLSHRSSPRPLSERRHITSSMASGR